MVGYDTKNMEPLISCAENFGSLLMHCAWCLWMPNRTLTDGQDVYPRSEAMTVNFSNARPLRHRFVGMDHVSKTTDRTLQLYTVSVEL